jgi:hypothetical protein
VGAISDGNLCSEETAGGVPTTTIAKSSILVERSQFRTHAVGTMDLGDIKADVAFGETVLAWYGALLDTEFRGRGGYLGIEGRTGLGKVQVRSHK